MTTPTKARRRFMAQQKQEAVALCLSEGLDSKSKVQRLGPLIISLNKWIS